MWPNNEAETLSVTQHTETALSGLRDSRPLIPDTRLAEMSPLLCKKKQQERQIVLKPSAQYLVPWHHLRVLCSVNKISPRPDIIL